MVARLRLRMAGLKCITLSSDDRLLVDAAVQEAQHQGAMVGLISQGWNKQSEKHPLAHFIHLHLFFSWFSPAHPPLQVPSTLPQCCVNQPPPLHLL